MVYESGAPTLVPAEPEDLDEIAALCRAVTRELPQCGWNEHYPNRELLTRDLVSGHLYKILREGKIVSMIKISPWEEWVQEEAPTEGLLRTLRKPCVMGRFCVAPALGGKGFGRQVIAASFAKAGSLGYDGVFFEAVTTNAIALHLYETLGFPVTGKIHAYGLEFNTYEVPFAP